MQNNLEAIMHFANYELFKNDDIRSLYRYKKYSESADLRKMSEIQKIQYNNTIELFSVIGEIFFMQYSEMLSTDTKYFEVNILFAQNTLEAEYYRSLKGYKFDFSNGSPHNSITEQYLLIPKKVSKFLSLPSILKNIGKLPNFPDQSAFQSKFYYEMCLEEQDSFIAAFSYFVDDSGASFKNDIELFLNYLYYLSQHSRELKRVKINIPAELFGNN